MCFDHDSRPPIAPIAGGASDAEPITLRGEDGAPFRAFHATPVQSTGAGILILPDVRGLHPFFEELALRYAEHGIEAIAIDYFGRTAGSQPRGDEFDYRAHLDDIRWDAVAGDIRAAVARLRSGRTQGSQPPAPRSVFATGFCMGGRFASLAATLGLGLAGVIPYYGWPTGEGRGGSPAPADVANRIECAVLAIYGGADHGISKDVRDAYDRALEKAGVEHETLVYDGAPHSFFDRKQDEFADASADAWAQTLRFIRRHTQGLPFAGG